MVTYFSCMENTRSKGAEISKSFYFTFYLIDCACSHATNLLYHRFALQVQITRSSRLSDILTATLKSEEKPIGEEPILQQIFKDCLIGWQNFQHDFRARSIYRFLVWKISLPCHANIEDFGFCVSVHYFSWLWISTEMTNKVVRLFSLPNWNDSEMNFLLDFQTIYIMIERHGNYYGKLV